MNAFKKHWEHWWFRACPPHAIAIVRICMGLYLLWYWARYLTRVPLMFSTEGIPLPLFSLIGPQGIALTYALFFALLIACLCLGLGVWSRFATVAIILLSLHFWNLNMHLFPATIHRILFILLCVLLFSGMDRTLSLRALYRHGSLFAWEPISILPQRLIALQITATYLGAGWQKLVLPAWESGELLSYSLISSHATPMAFAIANLNVPIAWYDTAVYGIKFFFFCLPFALWIPKLRPLAFLAGALFHILVALLLSIWSFIIMIPLYIVFLQPERVEEHVELLLRRKRFNKKRRKQ